MEVTIFLLRAMFGACCFFTNFTDFPDTKSGPHFLSFL